MERPLVLTGRVPVKIDPESGPIAPGDYLTSSGKPGLAMKAEKPGRVLGIALEAWGLTGSSDRVLAFINPHGGVGAESLLKLQEQANETLERLERLERVLGRETGR